MTDQPLAPCRCKSWPHDQCPTHGLVAVERKRCSNIIDTFLAQWQISRDPAAPTVFGVLQSIDACITDGEDPEHGECLMDDQQLVECEGYRGGMSCAVACHCGGLSPQHLASRKAQYAAIRPG